MEPTKLTMEIIQDAIRSLPKPELRFRVANALTTTQTIVKVGNDIYLPPSVEIGEIKVIDIPEYFDSPKFISPFYFDEPCLFRFPHIMGLKTFEVQ